MVMGNLHANAANAKNIMAKVLENLEIEVQAKRVGTDLIGTRKYAIATKEAAIDPEIKSKLQYLWGLYIAN
jgi:hypothetical protein